MFFANSNIDTRDEYDKRLGEAKKLAAHEGVRLVALPYDHEEWLHEVASGYEYEPEQGERCRRCFHYNLKKALEYACTHQFDEFTTSLTISPHKSSAMIFEVAKALIAEGKAATMFLDEDFKQGGGYAESVRRAQALGLYRQNYCGCEFSKAHWIVHHQAETESTNHDARDGKHLDVFTADYQRSGRGRLDHKWLSPPKTNLMMSAVLSVEGLDIEHASTLPLMAGLAVAKAIQALAIDGVSLKWPNDILVAGRKIAGILCERRGENAIVGIGLNVNAREFPEEIKTRATSLAIEVGKEYKLGYVRNCVLGQLYKWYGKWRDLGFNAIFDEVSAIDALKGTKIAVLQTDDDDSPLEGPCEGINSDGTLSVAGTKVYAGEAHILAVC